MSTNVLLVDANLSDAERMAAELRAVRPTWTTRVAASADDARAAAGAAAADVVIANLALGGEGGLKLLTEFSEKWPQSERVALSPHGGPEHALGSVGVAQRLLAKPCDGEALAQAIERSLMMTRLLEDERLDEMASRLGSLPAMPSIYNELVTALQSPDASLRDIGAIIAKDAAMTAHILRLVNSAHFGLMREISNVGMAVNYLGVMTVSSLALSLHVFDGCDKETLARLRLAQLWNRSFATGAFARVIAQHEGLTTNETDDAFTAGLLHACGKLVLASNLEKDYLKVVDLAAKAKEPVDLVESRELGFSHCEAGALMLARWGLSGSVVESVAYHRAPREIPHGAFIPLTAVHVASALAAKSPHEWVETPDGIDLDYLARLGIDERLESWIDACREVADLEGVPG